MFRVLERHPKLNTTFAHFFFLSEHPEKLEELREQTLEQCTITASYFNLAAKAGIALPKQEEVDKSFAEYMTEYKDLFPLYYGVSMKDYMIANGLTLSSPDPEIRKFWIDHGKACIRISQYLAEELGQPCVMNIWAGDGFKDIPVDRIGPRMRYKQSFDEILSEPFDFEM